MKSSHFRNRPNFQIEAVDGQKYWVSRSVAVVVVSLFHCDGLTYVPLGRRSPKMSLFAGFWGIPCGFLDWNESASEAAVREVLEETGLDMRSYTDIPDQPQMVISTPNPAENDTVSLRFILNANVDWLPELTNSSDEVEELKWLEISSNPMWDKEPLAFNHAEIIRWAQSFHWPIPDPGLS